MMENERRETAEALRRAVTAAIRAGNHRSEVEGIVKDQLFGITYFGLEYIESDEESALLAAAGDQERPSVDEVSK